MVSAQEQKTINHLHENWIWTPNWIDASPPDTNTAGLIVNFTREFPLSAQPTRALCHFSADTRYKLYVNGTRIAVGPSRSSPLLWYYDTLDIAPYLRYGNNKIQFQVARYFATALAALPFARTSFPGLTVIGTVETDHELVDISSQEGWMAQVDETVRFPVSLVDDVLHIYEHISPTRLSPPVTPISWGFKSLNGGLLPWRLRPRVISMPEETPVAVNMVRSCESEISSESWSAFLSGSRQVILPEGSTHTLEIQAEAHSTAFIRWVFHAAGSSQIQMTITYSEGYELESDTYPFFRNKADRLDAKNGHIVGPYDKIILDLSGSEEQIMYEPFWFRTFRVMRLEITVGPNPVTLVSFTAAQVNYPMAVKAEWKEPKDAHSEQIWDVSIRTLRNCMFDGYSDCPFYEQLQYSGDSRSVGLFHYLLSGDDRLMRQTITNFSASVTFEGLTQSRFPCHAPQLIAGFPLFWILQVCDHYLYFGDTAYTRSFLPRIDEVLEFFNVHIDHLGLVSGLPQDVWQYVDWVTTWGATDEHPDKGVPTSGRKTNRHTYFSMLYAYVLQEVAKLVRQVRPGYVEEYESRAEALVTAIRKHCYDGRFFTDSTVDVADELSYSQHCQVFAILCGASAPEERSQLLNESFKDPRFSKCSYVMRFYAMRAFALAGDEVYESFWPQAWDPWRKMLKNNLSTWEEDDVRHRSDCHAWGSVPIYEFCTELAGIKPLAPGCSMVLFKPRVGLSEAISVKVALGRDNVASVSWTTEENGEKHINLQLESAVTLACQLPGQQEKYHGITDHLTLVYKVT